ncbi:MAG: metal dependent phosphohydrolase [Capsulimonas sp.]|nr:metal dependent phosphohydrolase [Capsulimonas sp.]
MKRQFAKILQINEEVDDVFVVASFTLHDPPGKKRRLEIVLQDHTGQCTAVRWDVSAAEHAGVRHMTYVHVRGRVGEFNGVRQIHLTDWMIAAGKPEDETLFHWARCEPLAQLSARLDDYIRQVTHSGLRSLLNRTFTGPFRGKFALSPAAKRAHHAFPHGLLQHTLEVTDLAASIIDGAARWRTSDLSRDLVIAGALLHDIGKVHELEQTGDGYQYTRQGHLIGHTMLGYRRVAAMMAKEPDIPEEMSDALQHIILSHHGRMDYGAPVTPSFPEALIVHMADDLSAKLYIMWEAQQNSATEFVKSFFFDNKQIYTGSRGHTQPGVSEAIPDREAPSQPIAPAQPVTIPTPAKETAEPARLPVFHFRTGLNSEHRFETRRIQMYGDIAAGPPRETGEEPTEYYDIDAAGLNPSDSYFLLTIDGESMSGDGLHPGDLILLRRQESAQSGDMVAAWFEDNRATVKRFYCSSGGEVTLLPSNPDFAPIPVPDPSALRIHGKVLGIAQSGDTLAF